MLKRAIAFLASALLFSGVALAVTSGGLPVQAGTFTVTVNSGCTTTPNQTWSYVRVATMVIVSTGTSSALQCASNGATFSVSGVPTFLQPKHAKTIVVSGFIDNSGTAPQLGVVSVGAFGSGGTFGFQLCSSTLVCNANFTASGNKAITTGVTWSYSMD